MSFPPHQHGKDHSEEMRAGSERIRQFMARPRPQDPDWNIHRLSPEFLEAEPLNRPRTVPAAEASTCATTTLCSVSR